MKVFAPFRKAQKLSKLPIKDKPFVEKSGNALILINDKVAKTF